MLKRGFHVLGKMFSVPTATSCTLLHYKLRRTVEAGGGGEGLLPSLPIVVKK